MKKYLHLIHNFEHSDFFNRYLRDYQQWQDEEKKKNALWKKISWVSNIILFSFGITCLLTKQIHLLLGAGIVVMLAMIPALLYLSQEKHPVKDSFGRALLGNPEVLRDIAKLSIDRTSNEMLEELTQNVMQGRTDNSFDLFIALLDNYIAHHSQKKSECDNFLKSMGARNHYLNDKTHYL